MSTVTNNKNLEIAKEIIKQLGGNKFIMMCGVQNMAYGESSIQFKIRGSKKVSHVSIKLNSLDLYDITFHKCVKFDCKVVSEVNNIYDDMLQKTFTAETGLYTSL